MFLLFQFIEKRNSNQIDVMAESTIEERLDVEEITYVTLPDSNVEEMFITGKKRKFFTVELNDLKNQQASLLSDDSVVSVLEEPIPITSASLQNNFESFLKEYVLSGEDYEFWGWNKSSNTLIFFQQYQGKTVYFNEAGVLSVQLDEQDQMIGYEQTLLVDIDEIHDEDTSHEILPAIKALEILYNKNYLPSNSHVTKVDLGYYNILPVSGDLLFFAPTWHIVVNGETNYFVNAIEGQIIELVQGGVDEHELTF